MKRIAIADILLESGETEVSLDLREHMNSFEKANPDKTLHPSTLKLITHPVSDGNFRLILSVGYTQYGEKYVR